MKMVSMKRPKSDSASVTNQRTSRFKVLRYLLRYQPYAANSCVSDRLPEGTRHWTWRKRDVDEIDLSSSRRIEQLNQARSCRSSHAEGAVRPTGPFDVDIPTVDVRRVIGKVSAVHIAEVVEDDLWQRTRIETH